MTRHSDRVLATKRRICEVSESFLTELYQKWQSMFVITDDLALQGENAIITHLNEFFQEILASEDERKHNLCQRVQDKLRECHDLQTILNLPLIELDSGKPLSCLLDDLKNKLEEIEDVKQERLQQLENLREREAELCSALTEEPVVIENTVPSSEDLEAVDLHIFQLEEEKVKRFETYMKLRQEIADLIGALEVSDLGDWENYLIAGEDASFPVTANSMKRLKETNEEYKNYAEANKIAITELKERLRKLWHRMVVPEEEQEEFMAPLVGIGSSVKARLISEINVCQEKRRDMLIPLISRVRNEISLLCNQLTYTEEKREEALMLNENVSEELLDVLENKCDQLHMVLGNCQNILTLARKRNSLWERALELDEASHDKNRLFNNRGGQLLKEEKERKAIDSTLPKVHRELVKVLNDYLEKEGTPFLYYGGDLLETINAEWEIRMSDKENLRKKNEKSKRRQDAPESASKRAKVDNDSIIASSSGASNRTMSSTQSRRRSKGNGNTTNRTVFTPTVFTYEGMSTSMSYSRFQEDIAVSAGAGVASVPAAHSSPTDRRGTFTMSALPKTPVSASRRLRSARTPGSGIPRQKTPARPVLRSAAAATLAMPPRPQTPGTPRARPCALTISRTPSALRQNNMFI